MVFTALGAVAELERSRNVERVKAGLRNARAKGKRLGSPRVVDRHRMLLCVRRGYRGRRSPNGWTWAKELYIGRFGHPPKSLCERHP